VPQVIFFPECMARLFCHRLPLAKIPRCECRGIGPFVFLTTFSLHRVSSAACRSGFFCSLWDPLLRLADPRSSCALLRGMIFFLFTQRVLPFLMNVSPAFVILGGVCRALFFFLVVTSPFFKVSGRTSWARLSDPPPKAFYFRI